MPRPDLHRRATTSLSLSVLLYGITSNCLDARKVRAKARYALGLTSSGPCWTLLLVPTPVGSTGRGNRRIFSTWQWGVGDKFEPCAGSQLRPYVSEQLVVLQFH